MSNTIPDALLLIAPGCAHCPVVLDGLSKLIKAGKLGHLEVVNIAADPETAQQVGTRSVPWTRIGLFELEGLQSNQELEQWTQHATQGTGLDDYFSHLLATQQPHKVAKAIIDAPEALTPLLNLLSDDNTPMTVRIGIGVVFEDLHGNPVLQKALPTLKQLATSDVASIRADIAHYLGLSGSADAIETLKQLLQDTHPDVREIATESLAMLQGSD